MNRRNEDVEDLLESAQASLESGDYDRAVRFAREACALAPLRPDLRQFLADILAEAPARSQEPLIYREPHSVEVCDSDSDYDEDDETPAEELRRIPDDEWKAPRMVRPDPDTDAVPHGKWALELDEEEEEEDEDDYDPPMLDRDPLAGMHVPLPKGPSLIDRVLDRVSVFTKDMDDSPEAGPPPIMAADKGKTSSTARPQPVAPQRIEPMRFPPPSPKEEKQEDGTFVLYSDMKDRPGADTEDGASSGTKSRRPRKQNPDALFGPSEPAPPGYIERAVEKCLHMNSSVAVYGFIAMFLMVSSAFTYTKFFHNGKPSATLVSSTSHPTKPAETPSTPPSLTDEETITMGRDYLKQSRYKDAVDLLAPLAAKADGTRKDEAVALLAQAHCGKGKQLLEQNKLNESIANYAKAVDLSPKNAGYLVLLGNAYYYRGTVKDDPTALSYLQKAKDPLKKAIELDQKNRLAYERLISVYKVLNETDLQRATESKYIKIIPKSSEATVAGQEPKALSMADK